MALSNTQRTGRKVLSDVAYKQETLKKYEMLTPETMTDMYISACVFGFASIIGKDYILECSTTCDGCPAEKACIALSENGSYSTFCINYKEQIAPLLKQKEL